MLSPEQMTFIKERTAGVGFPRLNTRNWNKEQEGEKNGTRVESEQSDDFLHLLLQYYCLTAESYAEGVSLPQALSEARRICVFFLKS